MLQRITTRTDRVVPRRLATIVVILSFAIAMVIVVAKFTGPHWHPNPHRWGPVFTVYGYNLNTVTVVFLIGAAMLLYGVMLTFKHFKLPKYFLTPLLSILFATIFYLLRSNVKIGEGTYFTMFSTVGILHYKEPFGTYIMHIAYVLFAPLGLDPHQSIVLLYCLAGGVTAALFLTMMDGMIPEDKEWAIPVFFLTICQFGVLQQMAADTETYAPFMFGLMAYVIVCLKVFKKNAHPIIPCLAFGIVFLIHSASIFLLPSLIIVMYILINRRKRDLVLFRHLKKGIALAIFSVAIGIGIPYFLLYGVAMKNLHYVISDAYGGISGFVPLDQIFSFKHLMTVLSMQFLLQPSVWGVMLTVWLAIFVLFFAERQRFIKTLKDLVFNAECIFLLFAFMGLFFYSTAWNIYAPAGQSDFLMNWHTFSGVAFPTALLSAFWLVRLPLDRFKKHIVFSLWIAVSLVNTLPLVWWNHTHQSFDFANFLKSSEPTVVLDKDLRLVAELDVGDPESEKRFDYSIGKTLCTEDLSYPPGGRYVYDYAILNNLCRDGLVSPIAGMIPSFASIVDDGRLSFEGESFEVDLERGNDLFVIIRMHTGLGGRSIQMSIDNKVLSEIYLYGIKYYKRYHFNNPVQAVLPVEWEWHHFQEFVFFLPGSDVTGGFTRINVLNRSNGSPYHSAHYFVYQKDGHVRPTASVKRKKEHLHLISLKSFEDRIMGGTWRRIEKNEVPISLRITDPGYDKIFYRSSIVERNLAISLSVKGSWVDSISFLAANKFHRDFFPCFLTSMIFGDDIESGQDFYLLFDEMVLEKQRKRGNVAGVHLVAGFPDKDGIPQFFQVMSESHPSADSAQRPSS